jgi:hypothetical protein
MRAVLLLSGLTFLSGSLGHARADVLDQSYTGPFVGGTAVNRLVDKAQTFTVGIAGELSAVRLDIFRNALESEPLHFDLRTTAGGFPTQPDSGPTVLAEVTIPASDVGTSPTFFEIDLTPFNIPVSVGEVLGLVLRSDADFIPAAHGYEWELGFTDLYPRGESFFRTPGNGWSVNSIPASQGFETFVQAASVPEIDASGVPSAFTLLLGGVLVLKCRWRRWRH